MTPPVRPRFQDGQRLTARQLNDAVDYLRTNLRRVLMGPFGPGVGAGLELSPEIPSSGQSTFTIAPGVAIDGLGRILVLEEPKTYAIDSTGKLTEQGGSDAVLLTVGDNQWFTVVLEADDAAPASSDACSPAGAVVERVTVRFDVIDTPAEAVGAFLHTFATPSGPSWADLPDIAPPGSEAGVQLGVGVVVSGAAPRTVWTSMIYRQGMSANLTTLRTSLGHPAIELGTLKTPTGYADLVFFSAAAGGPLVQATQISAFGSLAQAGRYSPSPGHGHVFEFAGGSSGSEVPAGLGGLAAIPYEVSGDPVLSAGRPLCLAEPDATAPYGTVFNAHEFPADASTLLGLSAGPEYVGPGGKRIVPVATAGIVKARVDDINAIGVGTALTAKNATKLQVATPGVSYVVGRAIQPVAAATVADILVWVVFPAVRLGATP